MNELHTGLRLYRAELRDAIERDLRRVARPAWRWAFRVAVPATAAAAAIAALLVVFTGGPQVSSADAAILHRVAASLAPPGGTILHERATVTVGDQAPMPYELWEQADSPHAYRVVKFGHEGAWNGSAFLDYDEGSNTINSQAASGGTRDPNDPAAALRSLVESGQATVDAETTYRGVPAYRLTVNGAAQRYLNGTVYVDRTTYRPLRIETTMDLTTGPVYETIDFQTYEYLPATTANLELLDIAAQHPGARVVSAPASGKAVARSK
jgi:hypothetical protein